LYQAFTFISLSRNGRLPLSEIRAHGLLALDALGKVTNTDMLSCELHSAGTRRFAFCASASPDIALQEDLSDANRKQALHHQLTATTT
jgi:hypothetical protein